MNTAQRAAVESLPVGTVINGRYGRWTLLGTPAFSHPATSTAEPCYRATAMWEGNGGQRVVTLTFSEGDVS